MGAPAWRNARGGDGGEVHVVPLRDTMAHPLMRQCLCRPDVEEVAGGVVVVHHAADGREYFEADHLSADVDV